MGRFIQKTLKYNIEFSSKVFHRFMSSVLDIISKEENRICCNERFFEEALLLKLNLVERLVVTYFEGKHVTKVANVFKLIANAIEKFKYTQHLFHMCLKCGNMDVSFKLSTHFFR